MRIGVDLTALLENATGVDVYMLELTTALARIAPADSFTWFVNREDRARVLSPGPNVEVRAVATRARAARLGFQQLALPLLARRFDVLHSPSFILPLAAWQTPQVLTVHEMTSFTHPETHITLRRSRPYRAAMLASIRRARRILVPSAAVAAALERTIGDPGVAERLRVVGHGVAARFRPASPAEQERTRQALSLPERYVLFVGTVQPRKNLAALLRAFAELAAEVPHHLVLAGGLGWDHEDVRALAADPMLAGRVHLLGYTAAEHLPALYSGAEAFAYPSLEEGYGLPPLEAMACGAPVLISDTPALAERFGAAAARCGTSPPEIAAALRALLASPQRREQLRRAGRALAAGRGWELAAHETSAVYREAAAGGP